ncbi:hypothetical protein MRX96_052884 [Rhipicephalus microplus]
MSPVNAYVAKIGVRFVTIIVLYPLLASVGYSLSWQQCLIVAWANFKGAIMIALDLTRAFPNHQPQARPPGTICSPGHALPCASPEYHYTAKANVDPRATGTDGRGKGQHEHGS